MSVWTPFKLTEDLLTGNPVIDKQHRALVGILNDAAERLAEQRATPAIERVTRDLLAYAIYHFETEERLIKESGYDTECPAEAQEHFRQHRGFSERIVALRDDLRNGKPQSYDSLPEFLVAWLEGHIRHSDKRLGQFLAAHAQVRGPTDDGN
jgi:hemerythrin